MAPSSSCAPQRIARSWSTGSQDRQPAQKLQSLGKTYELLVYAGDYHVLSRNGEDADRRVIAWFKRHMR